MRIGHLSVLAAVLAVVVAGSAQGSIIFDDFNTNEGHFNQAPTYSSTSNVLTTSTADRTTTPSEILEGAGAEKLVLNTGTANPSRCRFLSGGGTPANNVAFTPTTGGTDGYIGFWYKILAGTSTGLKLGINLDSAANTGATMVGSTLKDVVADGQWHAVDWDLDNLADWGAVSGIGGGSSNLNGSAKTIDSIYFYYVPQPNQTVTVAIDYVMKTDSGHITPEPATMLVLGLGSLVLFRRRRA
jgi:hypothetical protein